MTAEKSNRGQASQELRHKMKKKRHTHLDLSSYFGTSTVQPCYPRPLTLNPKPWTLDPSSYFGTSTVQPCYPRPLSLNPGPWTRAAISAPQRYSPATLDP